MWYRKFTTLLPRACGNWVEDEDRSAAGHWRGNRDTAFLLMTVLETLPFDCLLDSFGGRISFRVKNMSLLAAHALLVYGTGTDRSGGIRLARRAETFCFGQQWTISTYTSIVLINSIVLVSPTPTNLGTRWVPKGKSKFGVQYCLPVGGWSVEILIGDRGTVLVVLLVAAISS